MKSCPVDCIKVEAIGKGKDQMLTRFDIDYGKCLFCDLCTAPCPTSAIHMTKNSILPADARGFA